MDPIVTMTVQQRQITCGVVVVVAIEMMDFHHTIVTERESTMAAFATLLSEKFGDPLRFGWISPQTGGPVEPVAVEGTLGASDFDV